MTDVLVVIGKLAKCRTELDVTTATYKLEVEI